MKIRIFTLFLSLALLPVLGGCNLRAVEAGLDVAEERVEQRMDAVEDQLESQFEPAAAPLAPEGMLTEEEAIAIALEHAGLTEDQVSGLRIRYEIDDRVPEYEIEFRQNQWEYDYTIHAETGEVLSYDRDD